MTGLDIDVTYALQLPGVKKLANKIFKGDLNNLVVSYDLFEGLKEDEKEELYILPEECNIVERPCDGGYLLSGVYRGISFIGWQDASPFMILYKKEI